MLIQPLTAQELKAFEKAQALHAQGKVPEAGQAYFGLLQRHPEHPDIHEAMGRLAALVNKFDHAEFHFRKCLAAAPERLRVLETLGVVVDLQGRREEALAIFRQGLSVLGSSPSLRVKAGIALSHLQRPSEALMEFEAALVLDPTNRDALHQKAEMLRNLGKDDLAFEAFRQLAHTHPDDAMSRYQWGCALLERGEWREGWAEYEARRGAESNPAFPRPVGGDPWDGQLQPGFRLLIQLEQGAGDTFQLWRLIPRLVEAGLNLVIQYPPSQATVIPLLQAQGLPIRWIKTSDPLPPLDGHVPLMSLIHLLGVPPEGLWPGPYLQPAGEALDRRRFPRSPSARACLGIAWAGSVFHPNDQYRSMSHTDIEPLLSLQCIHWVNLQKGWPALDAAMVKGSWTDPMADVTDYLGTAGIIRQLDAVVCVDTGVAHLAGAMGVPVLLMLPRSWEWRWMRDRADSPWYPGHRLFRQESIGDWSPVIEQVRDELGRMFPESTRA